MLSAPLTSQFALDLTSVDRLGSSARTSGGDQALREASKQFEAMFLHKMLTSMRSAYLKSDLLNSNQSDFYQSLMDQQWAQTMAGEGMGLADQLIAQLDQRTATEGRSAPAATPEITVRSRFAPAGVANADAANVADRGSRHRSTLAMLPAGSRSADSGQSQIGAGVQGSGDAPAADLSDAEAFVSEVMAHARTVEQRTGVPAKLMVAQAVLETGWGNRQIRSANGDNSYNLFGIKAGPSWRGDTVDIVTHEYIDTRRVEVQDRFRAYSSYSESFMDYAGLITSNPRYEGVLSANSVTEAVTALQSGGYATDPDYASKLLALLDQGLTPNSDR